MGYTTPFSKIGIHDVLSPKKIPSLSCLNIVEKIDATIVLFVITSTYLRFGCK